MAGKIYIVRHGEGVHNAAIPRPNSDDPRFRDADLTIGGELQSVRLAQRGPLDLKTIGVILTSPLRRSVHTTLLAFSDVIHERFYFGEGGTEDGVKLVVDPNLQEIGPETWNTGSTAAELLGRWPNLDLSLLTSPWPEKSGRFDPARARDAVDSVLADLWDRTNSLATAPVRKNVVVVTHSGFAKMLTGLEFKPGGVKEFSISNSSGKPVLELVLSP